MKLFSAICLISLLISCSNPETNSNTTADPNTTTNANSNTSNTTPPQNSQNSNAILTSFNNLEIQFKDIQKRVTEERENWTKSYEEMQYPESTIQSLSEENQKKLSVLYQGARNQGERYQALIDEVSEWNSNWKDIQYRANLIKEKTDKEENVDAQNLAVMDQKIQEARQKIQDWNNRLSNLKAETVLIYNSINGIVISSGGD